MCVGGAARRGCRQQVESTGLQLEAAEAEARGGSRASRLNRDEVGEQDVARVISKVGEDSSRCRLPPPPTPRARSRAS
jgi:hypothetical protein